MGFEGDILCLKSKDPLFSHFKVINLKLKTFCAQTQTNFTGLAWWTQSGWGSGTETSQRKEKLSKEPTCRLESSWKDYSCSSVSTKSEETATKVGFTEALSAQWDTHKLHKNYVWNLPWQYTEKYVQKT